MGLGKLIDGIKLWRAWGRLKKAWGDEMKMKPDYQFAKTLGKGLWAFVGGVAAYLTPVVTAALIELAQSEEALTEIVTKLGFGTSVSAGIVGILLMVGRMWANAWKQRDKG